MTTLGHERNDPGRPGKGHRTQVISLLTQQNRQKISQSRLRGKKTKTNHHTSLHTIVQFNRYI